MSYVVSIDLESFDWNYWNENRIKVLLTFVKRTAVEGISSLAAMAGLNYSCVYDAVVMLEASGIIEKNGRVMRLSSDWKERFRSCRQSDTVAS